MDSFGLAVHDNPSGAAVDFHVAGSTPGTATARVASASHTSGPVPVTYEIETPVLTPQGAGFCVGVARQWVTDPGVAATATSANDLRWLLLLSQFPLCPGVQPPATAGVPPAMTAAAFWEAHGRDLLGAPAPSIPPGYALAGDTAYLETHSAVDRGFDNPTPAGNLHISAHGTFWINWGDGSPLAGPYRDPGGPYPDGDITHVWTATGAYTVTVYEVWSATWSLAGQHGQLAALRTDATMPSFPVRQLEAVRNR